MGLSLLVRAASLLQLALVAVDASGDLFAAIEARDVSAMKTALSSGGADVNAIGPGGQTPLMNSVLTGCLPCVEFLLGREGVDAAIPEKDGYTPMHGAGFQGRPEIASRYAVHLTSDISF